jgi:DNA-directed RNA polymerase specialized sigma24 family protein
MCRHAQDAEDILQDTFLAAFRHARPSAVMLDSRPGCTPSRPTPAAERGVARDPSAGRGDRHDGPAIPVDDWTRRPDVQVMGKETRRAIEAAVASLPKDQRLVLVLRDMEDCRPKRSAGSWRGRSTVKSRLHRARLAVRSDLTRRFQERAR